MAETEVHVDDDELVFRFRQIEGVPEVRLPIDKVGLLMLHVAQQMGSGQSDTDISFRTPVVTIQNPEIEILVEPNETLVLLIAYPGSAPFRFQFEKEAFVKALAITLKGDRTIPQTN